MMMERRWEGYGMERRWEGKSGEEEGGTRAW